MKNVVLFIVIFIIPSLCLAQQKDVTKMDKFTSKTGQIIKFIDHNLPSLSTRYSALDTKIRLFESGGGNQYFFQIAKEDKYGDQIASIALEDLEEILKALKSLKKDNKKDVEMTPDYLENKFITEDGFQVGYYVSKGKTAWFIVLERFGSNNTVFFNDLDTIENAFVSAKNKIYDLKNKKR